MPRKKSISQFIVEQTKSTKRHASPKASQGSGSRTQRSSKARKTETPRRRTRQNSNSSSDEATACMEELSLVTSQASIDDNTTVQSKDKTKTLVSEKVLEQLSQTLVFYLVSTTSSKIPVARGEIMKLILANHDSRCYPDLIQKTNEILGEVFGYTICSMDDKPIEKSDKLCLRNTMTKNGRTLEEYCDDETKARQVLLSVILMCIQLSGGSVTEDELNKFLEVFHIQAKDADHEVYGNIPHLFKFYKTAGYLSYKSEKHEEERINVIRWGKRAYIEMDMKEMYTFVTELYPSEELASLFGDVDGLDSLEVTQVEEDTMQEREDTTQEREDTMQEREETVVKIEARKKKTSRC